jgi:hypothetical protein
MDLKERLENIAQYFDDRATMFQDKANQIPLSYSKELHNANVNRANTARLAAVDIREAIQLLP